MEENKCTNCEKTTEVLDVRLTGLGNLIEEKIGNLKNILEEVKEQTMKTNGRVSSLERWRSYTTGAIAVVVFFISYVWFNLKK